MGLHPLWHKEIWLPTHAKTHSGRPACLFFSSLACQFPLKFNSEITPNTVPAFQIIFTPASSAEISQLPTPLQVEVLREFDVLTSDFLTRHPDRFGTVRRSDRTLYRYRAGDYRIYFEQKTAGLVIHRVLHKNSLKDFAFRSQLPGSEDEELAGNPKFWDLIDSANSSPAKP